MELIFAAGQDPLFFQLTDLGRQAAAVHLQVICKLLSVVGNGKLGTACGLHAIKQVCHKLFPGGAHGCDLQLPVKEQIPICHQVQKIVDNPAVEAAGIAAAAVRTVICLRKSLLSVFIFLVFMLLIMEVP